MRNLMLIALGSSGLLLGCLGQDPVTGSSEKDSAKPTRSTSALAASTTAPDYFDQVFISNFDFYYDNPSGVEMEAKCGPSGLLTGFGARVSNGNVTGIRIYCSDLLSNGNLGPQTIFNIGGTPIEATVVATAGYIVTGVGGIVNGSAFKRAVIYECPWDPVNRTIGTNCRYRASDGNHANSTTEAFWSVGNEVPQRYLRGIGLSAGYEALKNIKIMSSAIIRTLVYVPSYSSISKGSWETFVRPLPAGAQKVMIKTWGGTGDIDPYASMSQSSPVPNYSPGMGECGSWTIGNEDYCEIDTRSFIGAWSLYVHLYVYNPAYDFNVLVKYY